MCDLFHKIMKDTEIQVQECINKAERLDPVGLAGLGIKYEEGLWGRKIIRINSSLEKPYYICYTEHGLVEVRWHDREGKLPKTIYRAESGTVYVTFPNYIGHPIELSFARNGSLQQMCFSPQEANMPYLDFWDYYEESCVIERKILVRDWLPYA